MCKREREPSMLLLSRSKEMEKSLWINEEKIKAIECGKSTTLEIIKNINVRQQDKAKILNVLVSG